MTAMTYRLSVIHHRLDTEIRRELKRRIPDSIRLLRLMVKDRLAGNYRAAVSA